jgi:hypothetical protein
MESYPYHQFMTKWNKELLTSTLCKESVIDLKTWLIDLGYPGDVNWLGRAGATPDEIRNLEQKLSEVLPPSYKQFLEFSNGWSILSHAVGDICSTQTTDFCKNAEPEKYQLYLDGWLGEEASYGREIKELNKKDVPLDLLVKISNPVMDACTVYMHLGIKTNDEAEIWVVETYNELTTVYPSFWDFLQATYQSFKWFDSNSRLKFDTE